MSLLDLFLIIVCVCTATIAASEFERRTWYANRLAMWRAVRRDFSPEDMSAMLSAYMDYVRVDQDRENAFELWLQFLALNGEWGQPNHD